MFGGGIFCGDSPVASATIEAATLLRLRVLFFFIPYILEVALKSRGKLKRESFGKPNKDGSLDLAYNKIYGLEHIAIWILKKYNKNNEKNVVYLIHFFSLVDRVFSPLFC